MNDASTKWVYGFGAAGADGDSDMRNLLGGKGANLAEMSGIGLPVPPGFTITTEVCTYYYDHERSYPEALLAQVDAAIAQIENETGARFADPANPLLVSVRSGARASMPGMMDTVLNLGLNDATAAGPRRWHHSAPDSAPYPSCRAWMPAHPTVPTQARGLPGRQSAHRFHFRSAQWPHRPAPAAPRDSCAHGRNNRCRPRW